MSDEISGAVSPRETTPLFETDRATDMRRRISVSQMQDRPSLVRRTFLSVRIIFLVAVVFMLIANFGRQRPVYLHQFAPKHGASTSPSPANGKVTARVLTYNTFIRPKLVGFNDFKDERLERLSRLVGKYDLMSFQELFWTSGPRKAKFLRNIALKHELNYVASGPVPGLPGLLRFPPKLIDAGLVIVSRFPIIKADYHIFSACILRSADAYVEKGVLYARIAIFGDKSRRFIHYFTVHLQASNHRTDGLPYDERRLMQVQELVNFAKEQTADDPHGVILIAGDFNIDGRIGYSNNSSSKVYSAAMRILETLRPNVVMQDLPYNAYGHKHPVTTAGGLDGNMQWNERIDYIFLNSKEKEGSGVPLVAAAKSGSVRVEEFRVRKEEGLPYDTLSDHYGLEAEIVISDQRVAATS